MTEQEKIQACYKEMYAGMIARNRQELEKTLADSFVLVHMTGMRQTREEYIHAIEDGTLNYYSAEHQHFTVWQQSGSQADLIGQSKVNAAVFGGGRHTWRLQLNCKLVKEGGVWKITEARASTY